MAPVQSRPRFRALRSLALTVTKIAILAPIVLGSLADRAAANEKVSFGYGSIDAAYSPWFYGEDKGYFRKHGLDVTPVFFDTGAKGVQGLVSGSVDLLSGDGSSLVNARMAGADVIAIGVTLGVLSGKVIVAKEITVPQQLKGKKWGISSFGSESQMAEQLFLKLNGLAETDVTTVQVGNQGNRFAALDADQIQVSTFLPPTSAKVEAAGYHVMAQLPELAPEYMSVPVGISTETLQKRRPMAKAFLEALMEATAAFKKDRAGGIEVIKKYLKSSDADAAVAYDYYAPLYNVNLRPTPKMVQFLLDHSADTKAKTMRPEEFYDVSLLEELAKAHSP